MLCDRLGPVRSGCRGAPANDRDRGGVPPWLQHDVRSGGSTDAVRDRAHVAASEVRGGAFSC